MFSAPMTKVDPLPSRAWLVLAAGMAFALMLAALFHVANGQVEQAGIRQAQYNAAQTALSGCAASYSGAVRVQCMEQVKAGFTLDTAYTPRIESGVPAMPDTGGFLQAAIAHP